MRRQGNDERRPPLANRPIGVRKGHRDDIEPGGDTMRGIYRLDGDKLVICVGIGGGDRPTEFKTTKDDQAFLDNLERVK